MRRKERLLGDCPYVIQHLHLRARPQAKESSCEGRCACRLPQRSSSSPWCAGGATMPQA